MKVRYKDPKLGAEGSSSDFNTSGLGEVIVGFEEYGMDSCFIRDLDVFLPALEEWKDMRQAFKDSDLIIDCLNTTFFEPPTPGDRERGYMCMGCLDPPVECLTGPD